MTDNPSRGESLHQDFVGMLFALATAEVAIQTFNVYKFSSDLRNGLPAYFHLALAFLVIVASWVGWGRSEHGRSRIESVFSLDFLELTLDVFLVTLYFLLVKSVDIDDGQKKIVLSFEPEILFTALIIGSYFVWDVLTTQTRQDKEKSFWEVLYERRTPHALFCGVLMIAIYWLLWGGTPSWHQCILVDLTLMSVVVIYRAIKDTRGENPKIGIGTLMFLTVVFIFFLALAFFFP